MPPKICAFDQQRTRHRLPRGWSCSRPVSMKSSSKQRKRKHAHDVADTFGTSRQGRRARNPSTRSQRHRQRARAARERHSRRMDPPMSVDGGGARRSAPASYDNKSAVCVDSAEKGSLTRDCRSSTVFKHRFGPEPSAPTLRQCRKSTAAGRRLTRQHHDAESP